MEIDGSFIGDNEDEDKTRLETSIALLQLDQLPSTPISSGGSVTTSDHLNNTIDNIQACTFHNTTMKPLSYKIGPNQQLYKKQYKSRIDDLILQIKAELTRCTLSTLKDKNTLDGSQLLRKEDNTIGPYHTLYKEKYAVYVANLLHQNKPKPHPNVANDASDSARKIDIDRDCIPPQMSTSSSSSHASTSPPQDETINNTQDYQLSHNDFQTYQEGPIKKTSSYICSEKKSSSYNDCYNESNDKGGAVGGGGCNLGENYPAIDETTNTVVNGRDEECKKHKFSHLNIVHKNESNYIPQNKNDVNQFHPVIGEDSSLSSIELARHDNGNRGENNFRLDPTLSPPSPTMASFRSPSYINGKLKKRLASSSGKKGADTQRKRHDDYELFNEDNIAVSTYDEYEKETTIDHCSFDKANTKPLDKEEDERSISFLNSQLCSQSPISYRESLLTKKNATLTQVQLDNSSSEESMTRELKYSVKKSIIPSIDSENSLEYDPNFHPPQNDIFSDENTSQKVGENDSIKTANSMTLTPKTRQRGIYKDNDPFNVSLRDDSHFHLDPLQIYRPPRWVTAFHERSKANGKKHKKNSDSARKNQYMRKFNNTQRPNKNNQFHLNDIPTLTAYQQPFKDFGTRTSERLEVVSEWLNRRDNMGVQETEHGFASSNGKAVILSVTLSQIISLSVYMMLQNVVRKIPHHKSCGPNRNTIETLSNSEMQKPLVSGGTLIIARSKDDLVEWECALRERTSFAVLNHSQMSSTERRHSKTVSKCVGFDVVLTTFDAVKAKEVATQVDEQGRAVFCNESQGGWLIARSCDGDTQPPPCEVLSILHGITWQRILFVDTLGRQSYLTKPATARCQSAIALKGSSRIIFFLQSSKENAFYEEKLKESRRQLVPLARLLDLPENKAADTIVGKVMLDLNDIAESNNQDRSEDIYHSQSSSSSEDYISESEVFS